MLAWTNAQPGAVFTHLDNAFNFNRDKTRIADFENGLVGFHSTISVDSSLNGNCKTTTGSVKGLLVESIVTRTTANFYAEIEYLKGQLLCLG